MPDFDSGNGMARDSRGQSLVSNGRVEDGDIVIMQTKS